MRRGRVRQGSPAEWDAQFERQGYVEFHRTRGLTARVMAAVLVLLGLLMIAARQPSGLVVVVFFGLVLALQVASRRGGAALRVDSEGLLVRGLIAVRIPWSAVIATTLQPADRHVPAMIRILVTRPWYVAWSRQGSLLLRLTRRVSGGFGVMTAMHVPPLANPEPVAAWLESVTEQRKALAPVRNDSSSTRATGKLR